MNEPPVNVRFAAPTIDVDGWKEQAQQWSKLNEEADGHPGFSPLTIKAGYVIGVIHHLCSAVTHLLQSTSTWDPFYIPAYGIFASGVDLLGRCIEGNTTHKPKSNLLAGFKWLKEPDFHTYTGVGEGTTLVETRQAQYSIDRLRQLRHFAAHGQATTNPGIFKIQSVDAELLGHMPPLLARGLENYWATLGPNEPDEHASKELCNRLAQANVVALRYQPILRSWILFQGDGRGDTITNIFQQFKWSP